MNMKLIIHYAILLMTIINSDVMTMLVTTHRIIKYFFDMILYENSFISINSKNKKTTQ